jgi:glycerophosphoryl diester phosphodiesterase
VRAFRCVRVAIVEAEIADAIGRLGRRLYAWTVENPALFARIADLGVAGAATNDPAHLRAPRANLS